MSNERITGGLLGPQGPEIGCEECFEHLDAFVEAELGRAGFKRCAACVSPDACGRSRTCLGMRAHLEGCPACAEEHASLVAVLQAGG